MTTPLWEWDAPAPTKGGRVRAALESDIAKAAASGADLAAAPMESLRVLADQMDVLDVHMRNPAARVNPYARTPLATLAGQFADIYERFLTVAALGDEFSDALDAFRRSAADSDSTRPAPPY